MKFLVLVIFIFCFESASVGQGAPAHLAPAHPATDHQQSTTNNRLPAPAYLSAPAQLCWVDSKDFAERDCSFLYEPGVRVRINAPAEGLMTPRKPVRLIFYALPNGNSTEWTFGKRMEEGNDWHFDIQHIGAQTRFLRAVDTLHNYVVVYLEAENRSWGAWRKAGPGRDHIIKDLVEQIALLFSSSCAGAVCANQSMPQVELNSHSGGGNFIFGFMDACDSLPDYLCRISFIDSDYNWDDERYGPKLVRWLSGGDAGTPHSGALPATQRQLFVACYKDYVALYNGKPFISKKGGTWHRTKMMYNYLRRHLEGAQWSHDGGESAGQRGGQCEPRVGQSGGQSEPRGGQFEHRARQGAKQCIVRRGGSYAGQCYFYWKKNREKKIYHTVLVELNGFIHSELVGTPLEGDSYLFMGPRAYDSPNFLR